MHLTVDTEEMRPLVKRIVGEVLAELEAKLPANGRLAYSEAEAADLLGVKQHVLRDARLRGEVHAAKIMGGRVRYQRADLLEYLARCREA